jgi:hypothetical protein
MEVEMEVAGISRLEKALSEVIETDGKEKGSSGEVALSDLFPEEEERLEIIKILGKFSRKDKWKAGLNAFKIEIIRLRHLKYKIMFQYGVSPVNLIDFIPDKKVSSCSSSSSTPGRETNITDVNTLGNVHTLNLRKDDIIHLETGNELNNASARDHELPFPATLLTCVGIETSNINKKLELSQYGHLIENIIDFNGYRSRNCTYNISPTTRDSNKRCDHCRNVLKHWSDTLKKCKDASLDSTNALYEVKNYLLNHSSQDLLGSSEGKALVQKLLRETTLKDFLNLKIPAGDHDLHACIGYNTQEIIDMTPKGKLPIFDPPRYKSRNNNTIISNNCMYLTSSRNSKCEECVQMRNYLRRKYGDTTKKEKKKTKIQTLTLHELRDKSNQQAK